MRKVYTFPAGAAGWQAPNSDPADRLPGG